MFRAVVPSTASQNLRFRGVCTYNVPSNFKAFPCHFKKLSKLGFFCLPIYHFCPKNFIFLPFHIFLLPLPFFLLYSLLTEVFPTSPSRQEGFGELNFIQPVVCSPTHSSPPTTTPSRRWWRGSTTWTMTSSWTRVYQGCIFVNKNRFFGVFIFSFWMGICFISGVYIYLDSLPVPSLESTTNDLFFLCLPYLCFS